MNISSMYSRTVFSVEVGHEKKNELLNNLKDNLSQKGKIEAIDGIKVQENNSFVLVRPSRFEPFIRVYVEARSSGKLQKLSHDIKK